MNDADFSLVEKQLYEKATSIRKKAYAPYSRFKVGASILSDVGIHIGANVENASYGCTSCAEASAISDMIKEGGTSIRLICVSGDADGPVTPCGNCRQRIREFATKDTEVHMVNGKGELQMISTLETLLPYSFGPESLLS